MDPPSRRTKYEIWAEILEVCLKSPRSQSWIIRQLGLKTIKAKEALDFLVKRNLIELIQAENNNWDCYKTTISGKQALNDFYKLIRQYFHS